MSEMSKCYTDSIMFLHHMTATLQLQIHIIREIKIYGNYKKHAQTAKNDSFKADKTIIIVKIFILPLPSLACEPARNKGCAYEGRVGWAV